MGKLCELCGMHEAQDERQKVKLCRNCLRDYEKIMNDDWDAIRTYSNELNFPNASVRAREVIIDYARSRTGIGGKSKSPQEEAAWNYFKNNSNSATQNSGAGVKSVSPSNTVVTRQEYRLKYKKTMSTSEQREWIEKYISLKRFTAFMYTCVGTIIGFLIGRAMGYGWDFMMLVLLAVGAGIGGVVGTNSVGSAMMESITAEQSIVQEELLTEILNKMDKEKNS